MRLALQRTPPAPELAAGIPQRQPGNAMDITARIERRQVLSGLISEYRRESGVYECGEDSGGNGPCVSRVRAIEHVAGGEYACPV